MDKISELKEKLAWVYAYSVNDPYELDDFKFAFEEGFQAAMELQLPVKFAEFTNNSGWRSSGENNNKWSNWNLRDIYGNPKLKIFNTTKELYDYWIKNIYEPEK